MNLDKLIWKIQDMLFKIGQLFKFTQKLNLDKLIWQVQGMLFKICQLFLNSHEK